MKFVCLFHESELQVTELTEYKDRDTSIWHIIYINYSDTYLHHIATTGSTKYKACKSVIKTYVVCVPSLISFVIIALKY